VAWVMFPTGEKIKKTSRIREVFELGAYWVMVFSENSESLLSLLFSPVVTQPFFAPTPYLYFHIVETSIDMDVLS
jgi:hypothetical protein